MLHGLVLATTQGGVIYEHTHHAAFRNPELSRAVLHCFHFCNGTVIYHFFSFISEHLGAEMG